MLLILQAVCDRVIFFSDDVNYVPPNSPYTWYYDYKLPLPLGLTLNNCWSWRLTNGVLVYANEVSLAERGLTKPQVLLARNKQALVNELAKRIDVEAKPWLLTGVEQYLRNQKEDEAQALIIEHTTPTPLLDNLAAALGCSVLSLAEDVYTAATVTRAHMLKLEAKRLRLTRLINEAETQTQLEAVRRELYQ